MQIHSSSGQLLEAVTGGLPVPHLAKAGAAIIATGLFLDLFAHTVAHSIHDVLIGAFPLGEHLAHFVVVIGMALVLAGVVADGIRTQATPARRES